MYEKRHSAPLKKCIGTSISSSIAEVEDYNGLVILEGQMEKLTIQEIIAVGRQVGGHCDNKI